MCTNRIVCRTKSLIVYISCNKAHQLGDDAVHDLGAGEGEGAGQACAMYAAQITFVHQITFVCRTRSLSHLSCLMKRDSPAR
jgi:hypothetical protein